MQLQSDMLSNGPNGDYLYIRIATVGTQNVCLPTMGKTNHEDILM